MFALSGALVGVRHRLDLFGVLVLSFVAACGGGLLTFWRAGAIERWRNPVQSLYAIAALAGAGVVVLGKTLELPLTPVVVAGVLTCTGLRLFAIRRGWRLPVARPPDAA